MAGYVLQEICVVLFLLFFWLWEGGMHYATDVLTQSKHLMFILNSFGRTCLTFSVSVYITPAQHVSEFLTRRPSFHPTEFHVGFGGAYSESERSFITICFRHHN